MFKRLSVAIIIFSFVSNSFAQQIMSEKIINTIENNSIEESVDILKSLSVNPAISKSEQLSASIASAQLLEEKGDFLDACQYYTNASALEGTNTVKGQNLLLDAVRCTLSVADVSRGDFLLSTAMSNPQSNEIRSRANLYAIWSWILKSQTKEELQGPISVLETYVTLDTMIEFRPTILLMLSYFTADSKWEKQLRSEFPMSSETLIVSGENKLLPSPFWYLN